jgi:hypothetical protein
MAFWCARNRNPPSSAGGGVSSGSRRCSSCLAVVASFAWALPARARDASPSVSESLFAYVLVLVAAAAIAVGVVAICGALSGSTWSLSDALSEEADMSPLDKGGRPLPIGDGRPQVASRLRASASRFIALFGLVAILPMSVGFGLTAIRRLASGGSLPSKEQFKDIATFLFAGTAIFAPYLVNQFASVFDWLRPKS